MQRAGIQYEFDWFGFVFGARSLLDDRSGSRVEAESSAE
jgi:hypothetical protein